MNVLTAMLGNAAMAFVLALLALAVSYFVRSPAVRHFAWLLVLLKLVTPPLVSLPLPVLPASWAPVEGVFSTRPLDWVLAAWAVGAIGWFAWQGRRVILFRRRVLRAEYAGAEMVKAVDGIASALGIVHPPAVKLANGIGSPMLWGWGRGTVILFPRELLTRLSPEARDTLLAHELAHFLRRDHWVRVLEYIATGLFWWHPVVWFARSQIEVAEEESCDAWVVGGLAASPRRYAEALLTTVDYVAELQRPCLPPGACAANRNAKLLHRRLIGIVNVERPTRLRRVHMLIAAALLIQPVLVIAAPDIIEPSPEPTGSTKTKAKPSRYKPQFPPPREPRAWAESLMIVARDKDVLLRRPDGTTAVLGPGRPLAVSLAPDGKRLATAGPGALVRTWDDRGTPIAETNAPAAARAIVHTPDGMQLLVLDSAGGITVYDPQTLARVAVWVVEGPANSLNVSPDGRTIAVACGSWLADNGWVELWSIAERRKVASIAATRPVGATRFTPDGATLIVGAWDGTVSWRSLPSGVEVASRELTKDAVANTAFCPEAGTLPLDPPPEQAPPPSPVLPIVPDLIQEMTFSPRR